MSRTNSVRLLLMIRHIDILKDEVFLRKKTYFADESNLVSSVHHSLHELKPSNTNG